MELTSKERFGRILKHQPVDRIGLFEVFWRETVQRWSAEGHFRSARNGERSFWPGRAPDRRRDHAGGLPYRQSDGRHRRR